MEKRRVKARGILEMDLKKYDKVELQRGNKLLKICDYSCQMQIFMMMMFMGKFATLDHFNAVYS